MRKMTQPPPASSCHKCSGLLQWKRVDPAGLINGNTGTVYACARCGAERVFVAQRDDYAPRLAVA